MMSRIRSAVGLALLPVLVLASCDLGTYEQRRSTAMATVNSRAAGVSIPAKGGGGTGVSFSLPASLGRGTDIKGLADPLTVDGLVGMYVSSAGPVLLVGGVPMAEGQLEKVVANVTAALQAVAPGQQVQQGDVKPTIKRLLVTGQQKFMVAGKEEVVPGKTDAYVISSATHVSLLIFRSTDAADAAKAFEGEINAALATIAGDALPAPAAPAGT